MITYDEMNDISKATDIKKLEEELEDKTVETTASVAGKIKMAHNLGYARGYKAAMRKYAVTDTNVKKILDYEQE